MDNVTDCCAPAGDGAPPDCCAPIVDEPLTVERAERLAGRFGVLADPTRLRLLSLIGAKGEACAACEMVEPLGVSQPTVSHHLKILRQAGLVVSEKRGRWVYYRTVAQRLAALSRILQA
ncbi:MAG: helix-turn-helix transcriptional regulator [Acidimicrobiia bacterium]|nr:helix-turn-helix transcriptional regulator [Acidimicrobiia bacterium]